MFILTYNLGILNNIRAIQLFVQIIIIGSLLGYILIRRRDDKSKDNLIYLIMFLGLVMRIGYLQCAF